MENLPEPTADGEPEPAEINEPKQTQVTKQILAPEPEPHDMSDQVRELVEIEGMDCDPAHTPTADGKLQLASGN